MDISHFFYIAKPSTCCCLWNHNADDVTENNNQCCVCFRMYEVWGAKCLKIYRSAISFHCSDNNQNTLIEHSVEAFAINNNIAIFSMCTKIAHIYMRLYI